MSYKSAEFRSPQSEPTSESKYRSQVSQLQECFPDYSVEDLQSLLSEVGGDTQLAADRITEGHAEQWSVKIKKDKKSLTPSHPNPKDHPTSRDRTDSRGSRGGRGGRGGLARGPRGRGSARGHGVNGHASRPSHPGKTSSPAPDSADKQPVEEYSDQVQLDKPNSPNGILSATHDSLSDPDHHADPPSDLSIPPQSFGTPSSWGSGGWGAQDYSISAPATSTTPISVAPKPTKLPATSKLSWAQVARSQEKPAAAPAPPAPRPPIPAPELSVPVPAPFVNGDSDPTGDGWEDPITVQPPTWDDEPQVKPPPEDAWSSPVQTQPDVQDETPAALPQEEPAPEISPPVPSEPTPAPQSPSEELVSVPPPSKSPVSVPPRSSAASHRSANKYKATDQAVVMPSSSFNPGLEKVGMQFGSLSLGGDVVEPSPTEPAPVPEPTSIKVKQSPQQLIQPLSQPQAPPQESPVATTPVQPTTAPSQIISQQQAPPSASAPPPSSAPVPAPIPQSQPSLVSTITHASISSSVSQPIISTSPGFSQQPPASIHPSLSQHQQQTPLTQHQGQTHQYTHHSLPAHLDAAQNPTQQTQHAAQPSQTQASAATHSAYFRQAEAPYFHTPTPPAGQGQDYNLFGQIGQQHQASHLSGFANNDYGYSDNQRGFYDTYAQSPAFGGSRNVLGHDDVKGLPNSQQLQGNSILQPSNAQSSQLPPQGGAQPQPSGSQGPQQSYPPPLPYYYPYPQNQYYGSPYNSGYGVPQPFVKYPTVFQPGPPAQGAAPSPGGKQGPGSVQSQSDHYGRGLYGQQHQLPSSGYDDLYQHHAPQHNHAPGVNNLTSNDYAKHPQLYGGQAIQSFMGLGQGSGTGSGPSLAQRASGTSPEAAYKPYSQNVGVKDGGSGVGVGQGVGQPQSGRGVQQAHGQGSFYGGNRFGSSASAGGPQGQQGQQGGQGPQGHVGYPQSNSDANFYQYQPRQQQGYWQ